jgi:two-component system chemotaxis response regulator CheB
MVSALTAEGADATLAALRLGAVDFVPKPEGAVSLRMGQFAPRLVEKVRAAASAKLRASQRLREKVQHRIGGAVAARRVRLASGAPGARVQSGNGQGDRPRRHVHGRTTGTRVLALPLPASFPWPIVIAQHMPASFTGPLARRLDGIAPSE